MSFVKGIVAYDSVHGSTKQVAEAIAEQIRSDGHEVELMSVKEGKPAEVAGDFMFIGSPTRGGKMTKETKSFIEGLNATEWKDRPIVAFDTIGPFSKDVEKRNKMLKTVEKSPRTASAGIQELCRGQGLSVSPNVMHIAVVGMWGPLAPDASEMAKDFARKFLAELK
jgi:flavodoxin